MPPGDAAESKEFGELLRQHRLAARMTQEALAERAGLSVYGIQKLERGTTHPYRDTFQRLVQALELRATDLPLFSAAAAPLPRRRRLSSPQSAPSERGDNLPIPNTSFIPRSGEIPQVKRRLRANRLLTITGPGGIGKSRLALEVAREVAAQFADGTWLAELAHVADPALVAPTVAGATGICDVPGQPVSDALSEHLRRRHVLLVLDNCEHVIDACAELVDQLLSSCLYLRIIATSREVLGVVGEAAWRVRALAGANPDMYTGADRALPATVAASEAAQLFVDRARLVVPAFAVTDQNATAVAHVTQRLDGIPLAIELAAAKLAVISVDQISARLDQRLRLLSGGHRSAVRRQQTLRATIDWSYELLSPDEQCLLRGLAVFAGGWSLEAAEALGVRSGGAHHDVLDLLSRLVAKSIVLVDGPTDSSPDAVRYHLPETLREYASEKLAESGEADAARTRHRDWYLQLAEEASLGMQGHDQKRWWDCLELEHDNLRAALAWSAAEPGMSDALLRLATSLGRFWQTRGHIREGIRWLEVALARSETSFSSPRARALCTLGMLESWIGNAERAQPLLEEGVAQARALCDHGLLSHALRYLGAQVRILGNSSRRSEVRRQTLALAQEALAVSRTSGGKLEMAWSLAILAERLLEDGQYDSIEPLLLESITLGKEAGDMGVVVPALRILGRLYAARREFDRARMRLEEALVVARGIDLQMVIPSLLFTLGDIATADEDLAGASDWYGQGIRVASRSGLRGAVADGLRSYALVVAERGEHVRAVRIIAAASNVHNTPGSARASGTADIEEVAATIRRAVGEDDFTRLWGEGRALTLDEAITEAFAPAESESALV
jgi:predicted ATPase/DNA-binding XRE family transcriptional regulator